mmetsp:Transcript_4774/g.9297  ORF Transcript_4774/g.9297 Transcript_4774/m.9297 type:complete len:689 (-) Transcript_4774:351-2417(-)
MDEDVASGVKSLLAEVNVSSPLDLEAAFSDSLGDAELESELFSPRSDALDSADDSAPSSGRRLEQSGRARLDAILAQEAVEALQAENVSLRRSVAAAEARAAEEIRKYKAAVEAAQVNTRHELDSLRSALQAMQSDAPELEERMKASKDEFRALRISADRYASLRELPHDKLTLLEFVQMRAHELVQEAEAPLEQLRQQQQTSLMAQSGAAAQLHAEGAARLAAETELRQLKSELHEVRFQLETSRSELANMKAAAAAAVPLGSVDESAIAAAESRARDAEQALGVAKSELSRAEAEMNRVAAEALQRQEMLRLDKDYLVREVESSKERLSMLETKLLKKEGRVAELKAEKDAMYDKLLAASSEQHEAYSARLEAEMSKWQEQAKLAQESMRDAHERQLAQHRDGRDLALADADKWHTRYAEVKRQYDEQLLASSQQLAESEVQLATVRAELKLKTFECERLALQCEQSIGAARRDELATDAAKEKLELLKAEYYALQSRTAERAAEMDAKHSALIEKLNAYEALEAELDKSVMQAGLAQPTAGESTSLMPSMPALRVPSSSQRRLEQCLALSRDLLASQRTAESLRATLLERSSEVERLKEQLVDAQRRIRLSAQPQAFLAEQLHISEQQVHQLQRRLEAAATDQSEQQEAMARLQQQVRMLKTDLERVLQQRGSLDALRTTLSRLI